VISNNKLTQRQSESLGLRVFLKAASM